MDSAGEKLGKSSFPSSDEDLYRTNVVHSNIHIDEDPKACFVAREQWRVVLR